MPDGSQRFADLILRFKVDQNSEQQAASSLSLLNQLAKEQGQTIAQYGEANRQATDLLNLSIQKSASSWEAFGDKSHAALTSALRDAQALSDAQAGLAPPDSAFGGADDGSGGGGFSGRISGRGLGAAGRLATRLGAPAGVGSALSIAGEAATATGGLQRLGDAIQSMAAPITETLGVSSSLTGSFIALAAIAAPIVITLGALAVILKLVSDNTAAAVEAEKKRNVALQARLDIENSNIKGADQTPDQNSQFIADKLQELKNTQDAINQVEARRKAAADDFNKSGPLDFVTRSKDKGITTEDDKILIDLRKKSDELNAVIANAAEVLAPEIKQREAEITTLQNSVVAIQKNAQAKIDTDKLIQTATSKQVQDRIIELQKEQVSQKEQFDALDTLHLKQLANHETDIEKLKLVEDAQKALAAQSEKTADELKLLKDNVEIPVLVKEAQAAVAKREEAAAKIQEKYDADTLKADEANAQKRIDIETTYQDKLVEIAANAVDKADQALIKVTQKRNDLQDSLENDLQKQMDAGAVARLDIEIKAQRTERDELINHQRKLEDIQKAAHANDETLALNRDFLGLLTSKKSTTQAMEAENLRYTRQQEDTARHTQDSLDDEQRRLDNERAIRLKAYQEQLVQAKLAYDREINQIAIAKKKEEEVALDSYNKQLALLDKKIVEELTLRNQGYQAELKLLFQTEQEKLKIQHDAAQKAINAQAVLSGGAALTLQRQGELATRAGGGGLNAGQWSMVNERGREKFNGIRLPGGAGVFFPLTNGTVNKGGDTSSVNNFYIRGDNEQMIVSSVTKALKQVMGAA